MMQQSVSQPMPERIVHPRRLDVFFHLFKTGKLILALIRDPRVPFMRKLLFFGSIVGLLAILVFPDIFSEAVLSVVLPFVGTILGIPLDAGYDWIAFALIIVSLLRVFPAEIVSEHYRRLFRVA